MWLLIVQCLTSKSALKDSVDGSTVFSTFTTCSGLITVAFKYISVMSWALKDEHLWRLVFFFGGSQANACFLVEIDYDYVIQLISTLLVTVSEHQLWATGSLKFLCIDQGSWGPHQQLRYIFPINPGYIQVPCRGYTSKLRMFKV